MKSICKFPTVFQVFTNYLENGNELHRWMTCSMHQLDQVFFLSETTFDFDVRNKIFGRKKTNTKTNSFTRLRAGRFIWGRLVNAIAWTIIIEYSAKNSNINSIIIMIWKHTVVLVAQLKNFFEWDIRLIKIPPPVLLISDRQNDAKIIDTYYFWNIFTRYEGEYLCI